MIEEILAQAFEQYPEMKPQDAVKLIYQNEFGPGHMIASPEKAMQRLVQEMAQTEAKKNMPLYENIGNGLCRLNLAPAIARGISAEMILPLFLDAAQTTKGDKKRFEKKLNELDMMAQNGETPFDYAELSYYLIMYREKGCPAVHHSAEYNAAYHPAYRVVAQKKLKDALQTLRSVKEESK